MNNNSGLTETHTKSKTKSYIWGRKLSEWFLHYSSWGDVVLTHWDRMTHICVSKLTIIGSDNGLAPSRRQAIISTNSGILLIRPSGTNFSEILIEIMTFSFKKMNLKLSSAKCRPFCRGLNVLTRYKLQTSMPFTIIDHVLDYAQYPVNHRRWHMIDRRSCFIHELILIAIVNALCCNFCMLFDAEDCI